MCKISLYPKTGKIFRRIPRNLRRTFFPIFNKDGKHDGLWTGYYPSGKLAGTATYISGKETEVKLYNEDGSKKTKKSLNRKRNTSVVRRNGFAI